MKANRSKSITTMLFPTQIAFVPLLRDKKFLSQLEFEARTFMELDLNGQRWSKKNYWGGYTSYASLSDLPNRSTTFDTLRKKIDHLVKRYSKSLHWDLEDKTLVMQNCWINIMGEGCHHSFHLHPHSVISGTFYVSVPKGAGTFKIEDPRMGRFQATPNIEDHAPEAFQRYVKLEPEAGDCVLFESWIKHEVPANLSKSERISISFNYSWN